VKPFAPSEDLDFQLASPSRYGPLLPTQLPMHDALNCANANGNSEGVQVQRIPPLLVKEQVRGPLDTVREGLLLVWSTDGP